MKTRRFFAILVTLALVLVLARPVFAGNELTTDTFFKATGAVVGIRMTADGAGAFTAANVATLLSAAGHPSIWGYRLIQVIVNHDNTTYCTTNSNLYVKDEDGADHLSGQGVAAMDATGSATDADTWKSPVYLDAACNYAAMVPVRNLIITITQAAVVTASASADVILVFVGSK